MTDVYGEYLRTPCAVRRARLFTVQVTARRKGKKLLVSPRTLTQPSDAASLYLVKEAGGDTYASPGKTYEAYEWKRVFYYQHSSKRGGGMCSAMGTRMDGPVIKWLSIVSVHVAVSSQKRSKRQLLYAVFL